MKPMDKLIRVLNQSPVKNDLDEAYLNRLSKDIKRIHDHTKQAEVAINSFDEDLEKSSSLEKRIIALYASYGNIPYSTDKNDTISTAATSVILEEMINEKRGEITKSNEESTKLDFSDNIMQLKSQRAKRLEQITELNTLVDTEFKTQLPLKLQESLELQKTLFNYLKKVLIKYLAISDRISGSVNTKDQVRENVRTLSNFFDSLLTVEWVDLPEGFTTIVDILTRDGVLVVNNNQAKLSGFDNEI